MRVVAALGGNAFVKAGEALSVEGEHRFAREALAALGPFLDPGVELLVAHGNGPQVGHQLERAERARGTAYALSLDVCVAQTQGELGYVLAQALEALLAERGLSRAVVAVVTQVEVAPGDDAFRRPMKPVGPVLDPAAAAALLARGAAVRDDAGRGVRRVVPSPEPTRVLEEEAVRRLLASGAIVVAGGGGGIPVVPAEEDAHRGVEAVVDKDLTAALLADVLDADLLLLLTDVPCAYTDHLGPRQTPIGRIACSRARSLHAQGHFAPGSMGPKIEAALRFVSGGAGRRAIVCDPPSLARALRGEAGTVVVPG
ncbi:carbamate kinase [Anaeromyxobacter terrae]|uniref:carbamate kinase n=1 Tax=Anaeromyxobacter terrae TaxID=2925406 RepID=UPI001F58D47E|nr:carbamate kinase [Anaeromyxobacter sp. SG22]